MQDNCIDTHLFVEIITSEGALLAGHFDVSGIPIEYYLGKNGKRVGIMIADEYLTEITAKEYLVKLGMVDLMPMLFIKEVVN